MTKLFEPVTIGSTKLAHRVAMAPVTRFRNDDNWTPTPMMKEYYEQRASVPGTLLITEATFISHRSAGTANTPGIWSPEQIAAWKEITTAVHDKGSFIYCQIWHQGRQASASVLASHGHKLQSSSATPMTADSDVPEAMTEEDIRQTIADFASAARNAIAAGFDGVEIHGANGYLPDQFLQTTCNQRSDSWGGSVENRARFHLEVARAVVDAVGADRTGIRLSPYSDFGAMLMEDPDPTFRYLVEQLKPLGLAYLHLIEARIRGNEDADCGDQRTVRWLVELWDNAGTVLLAGGFTPESARTAVDETYAGYDVVTAFGRNFIPNPDLVYRIRAGLELVKYDRSVFYTPKEARGYSDYPFSKEFQEQIKVH